MMQLRARTEDVPTAAASSGTKLDSLIAPAFATVREAAKRTLGQRHFDVQLIGGMALHRRQNRRDENRRGQDARCNAGGLPQCPDRNVAFMSSPSTIIWHSAMPAWMGQVYEFLGLTVGCIVNDLEDEERRDGLCLRRDLRHQQRVRLRLSARQHEDRRGRRWSQRGHYFAIVDEVDSILIDESRTPLIISGPSEDRAELYNAVDAYSAETGSRTRSASNSTRSSVPGRRSAEEGNELDRSRSLAEAGSDAGTLYDIENITSCITSTRLLQGAQAVPEGPRLHRAQQRGRHHRRVHRPHDAGSALLGRPASGHRGQGRHVEIQPENQTLASITFQNYFRLYRKARRA